MEMKMVQIAAILLVRLHAETGLSTEDYDFRSISSAVTDLHFFGSSMHPHFQLIALFALGSYQLNE